MLKAYFVNSFYKIDDEDWQSCGQNGYAIRDESEPAKKIKLDKADWNTVYVAQLDGIVPAETFFRHKPYIKVYRGWYCDNPRILRPGDFKEFSYADVYEEWSGCSLEWIMKHASAETAIQYMKERGMNVCPLQ